jgi:hypothetical protein
MANPEPAMVFVREVRQRFSEFATPLESRARNCLRRRAGLPHTQAQSKSISIQFGVRNIVQRRALAQRPRQLG